MTFKNVYWEKYRQTLLMKGLENSFQVCKKPQCRFSRILNQIFTSEICSLLYISFADTIIMPAAGKNNC